MQTTRRHLLLTGAAAIGALAAPNAGSAADAVQFTTALKSTAQSLVYIGIKAGIFSKLGLDVAFEGKELAGPATIAGLLKGDFDFIEIGSVPVVQAAVEGKDAVILLSPLQPSREDFITVRPNISDRKQLAGRRIGILSLAGGTGVRMQALLRTWDISAELVELKSFPRIYAALGTGEIDAAELPIDYRVSAIREFGLKALAIPAPGLLLTTLATTRRTVATRRDVVARMVRGYVESIHLFKTNPNVVIPLLSEYLGIFGPESIAAIHKFYAQEFQQDPQPSVDGIHAVLGELSRRFPAAKTATPDIVLETSFLQELKRSGAVPVLR